MVQNGEGVTIKDRDWPVRIIQYLISIFFMKNNDMGGVMRDHP